MTGLLLINLGTPDRPETRAVSRYLREFLSDPYVIDINPVARWLLVNLIIAPFRSPRSAKAYQKIWTQEGSPLLLHSQKLAQKLRDSLAATHYVELGMRYGSPSIDSAILKLLDNNIETLQVLPLYPQYAESTTRSSLEKIQNVLHSLNFKKPVTVVDPFFNHPAFLEAWNHHAQARLNQIQPDHVLFSYHGLPVRQILKLQQEACFKSSSCCECLTEKNYYCYRAQCFETTRLLAKKLDLKNYSLSFQSRLGRTPWIEPYTDQTIIDLAKTGVKRLAVLCPAFVADCLETLEEIGMRGKEIFLEHGGKEFFLIPSLNAQDCWIEALSQIIKLQPPPPVAGAAF